MAVTPAMIIAQDIVQRLNKKKKKGKNNENEKFLQLVDEQIKEMQAKDLSDQQQYKEALQLATPRDTKDEERVYVLGCYLLSAAYDTKSDFILDQDIEKQEDLKQKVLMCTNNLLDADSKNWEYWNLYGSVNDFAGNQEEAKRGHDIATHLTHKGLKNKVLLLLAKIVRS